MSDRTFHYFSKLPAEIRVMIWELCLPKRVAEYDGPWFLHDGFRARQACYSKSTIQRNSQIPKIASVSYEAREVALRFGIRWELPSGDDYPWLDEIWLQRHDVLHLNWVRHCWAVYASDSPSSQGKVDPFLSKASKLGMYNVSVTADVITPFRLDLLVGGFVPLDMIEDFVGDQVVHVEDIFDFGDAAYDDDDLPRELGVAMVAISLHLPEDAACKSGLFGLLGDEPVQMVDADDIPRLGEYEKLFHRHAIEEPKEPKIVTLFDLFRTFKFQDAVRIWKKEAEQLLLEDFWHWARFCDLISDDEPMEDQPFMQEARELSFRTRPQIMIRYCTNKCYLKENLPEGFGE